MINDVEFFEEFLDADVMRYYFKLVEAEENSALTTDLVLAPDILKNSVKEHKKIGYINYLNSIQKLVSYLLGCFLNGEESDYDLEQECLLVQYSLRLGIKNFKLLGQVLKAKGNSVSLDLQDDDISLIFLLSCSIDVLTNNLLHYMDNYLLENRNAFRGIMVETFRDSDLMEKDIERLETISTYCYQLHHRILQKKK